MFSVAAHSPFMPLTWRNAEAGQAACREQLRAGGTRRRLKLLLHRDMGAGCPLQDLTGGFVPVSPVKGCPCETRTDLEPPQPALTRGLFYRAQ
jgi:hypothetical protein